MYPPQSGQNSPSIIAFYGVQAIYTSARLALNVMVNDVIVQDLPRVALYISHTEFPRVIASGLRMIMVQ